MSFASYLIGTWEGRFGMGTSLQIINPMVYSLEIRVAFLDDDENFVRCLDYKLSPNKLQEIIVPTQKLKPKFGVVKIISHRRGIVREGIVGFQRHILSAAFDRDVEVAFSEAPLAAVSNLQYAHDEMERFKDKCPR